MAWYAAADKDGSEPKPAGTGASPALAPCTEVLMTVILPLVQRTGTKGSFSLRKILPQEPISARSLSPSGSVTTPFSVTMALISPAGVTSKDGFQASAPWAATR